MILSECALQLVSSTQTETEDAWRCKARLQHLKDIGPAPKDHVLDWNRKRLPLLLADHLLRTGYRETASFLVAAKHLQVDFQSQSTLL